MALNNPYIEEKVSSMVTRPCPLIIEECTEGFVEYAKYKMNNYTYAYHNLYNRLDKSSNNDYADYIKNRFSLCEIEYRSVVSEAKGSRKAEKSLFDKYQSDIEDYRLLMEDKKTTKQQRFWYFRKIARLNSLIGTCATFGKVSVMRRLTKEHNHIQKAKHMLPFLNDRLAELKNTDSDVSGELQDIETSIQKLTERADVAKSNIVKIKKELEDNRQMEFVIIGEANRKGNRFVKFDLTNEKIILNITNDQAYELKFKIPYKYKSELETLQKLIDSSEIPVTLRISDKYVSFSFEYAIVNGYAVDEKRRRKAVNAIKKEHYPEAIEKAKIKEVYRDYYKERESRMLAGKIPGRVIAIDMNPGEIGWAIIETNEDGTYRIIKAGVITWHELMGNRGWKSSSSKQKRLNNKRKNAVYIALMKLFRFAVHYRCYEMVIENLEFKDNNCGSHEANRKNKNLWYRSIITDKINMYCVKNGIKLLKINAAYTSFIGNIQHREYNDSTAAAIEIARRGAFAFTNGKFYPDMTERDIDTMRMLFGDTEQLVVDQYKTELSWVAVYKSTKTSFGDNKADFEHRYRTALTSIPKDRL